MDRGNVSTITLCIRFSQGDNLSVAALFKLQSASSDSRIFSLFSRVPSLVDEYISVPTIPFQPADLFTPFAEEFFILILVGCMALEFLKYRRCTFIEPHIRARSVPFFSVLSSLVPSLDFQDQINTFKVDLHPFYNYEYASCVQCGTACHPPPPSGFFEQVELNFRSQKFV